MVFFEKSQPAPNIGKKYNIPEVVEKLAKEFFNKCYICGTKAPININVEHFIAHKGDESLKLDWTNLFLSCSHCNNIKSDNYQNLLNCTILNNKVDTAIHYQINPFPKELANLEIRINSDKATETKNLLEKCFNGDHTSQKKLESSNLRATLLKEITVFQQVLFEYFESQDDYFLNKIKYHLNNQSSFTAFKRWIIRDNSVLNNQFSKYILN